MLLKIVSSVAIIRGPKSDSIIFIYLSLLYIGVLVVALHQVTLKMPSQMT